MEIKEEKQPRFGLAILAAIGFGLIGCLFWGLMYYFEFIAWVFSLLIVYLTAYGYRKFNLKMDGKGYVIVALIAIAETILTMMVVISIYAMALLRSEGYYYSFFEILGVAFEVSFANSTMLVDIILSIVFLLFGLLCVYLDEKRRVKTEMNKQNMQTSASVTETETNTTTVDGEPISGSDNSLSSGYTDDAERFGDVLDVENQGDESDIDEDDFNEDLDSIDDSDEDDTDDDEIAPY